MADVDSAVIKYLNNAFKLFFKIKIGRIGDILTTVFCF